MRQIRTGRRGTSGGILTASLSPFYHQRMDAELNQLEAQIEQLISLHGMLKVENLALRTRVVKLEAENHQLSEKVRRAAERLEAVLNKLPEA